MRKRKDNDGTVLETLVQQALTALCAMRPAFWHRFYDTKSARGFLPAQPGDFMLIWQGKAYLIECKSSDKDNCVPMAWRTPEQIGKHKLWLRAGGYSLYVHLRAGVVKILCGAALVNKEERVLAQGPQETLGKLLVSVLPGE